MSEADGSDGLLARFELPVEEGASKEMSLAEAIGRFVEPGDVVASAFAGARPCAPMFELVRRFAGKEPGLTLVTSGIGNAQHALVQTGVVNKVVTSFAGENYPAARPNPVFQQAVADGRIEVESWSLWTLSARMMAAALGVPFLPVRSLRGSSLASDLTGKGYAEVGDPFSPGGEPVPVVSALAPDVTVLNAVAADAHGNVVLAAPYGERHWSALAARRGAIVCVERIATTAELREHNALVQIPGHCVLAVCETPFGAHPYSLHNPGFPGVEAYVEDQEFMAEVARACAKGGFEEWIEEWILGTADHDAYVAKLGPKRLEGLRREGKPGFWREQLEAERSEEPTDRFNDNEMLVVAAGRQIARTIRAGGRQAVLAGVGLANLGAWLAADKLEGEVDSELMAEIGMYGYAPRPGEPFVFAHRNLTTCKVLTDIVGVLGTYVSGPGTNALGVFGAGQIDERGNVNSTWTASGQYMVGSGGANDIASGAQEVVVVVGHGRERLVKEVPYVTSPGESVSTVVTTLGVFERGEDGRFVLTRYFNRAGATEEEALELIREGCEWDYRVTDVLELEPDPTAEELETVRAFDPRRTYLRRLAPREAAEPAR